MRTWSRRIGVAAVAIFAVVIPARAAFAGNGFAMAVDVRNSQQTIVGEIDGSCTWRVTSDITLVNLTNESLTITGVSDVVSWTAPDDTSGVQNNVTIIDDGGLQSGVVMAAHEQRTFESAVVEFAIPCKATFGDLMVRVTTPRGTSSGDAPFLENGTPVPLTAVGALLLSAVLAVACLFVQRRRRRATVAA
jgi:hypothetical protein